MTKPLKVGQRVKIVELGEFGDPRFLNLSGVIKRRDDDLWVVAVDGLGEDGFWPEELRPAPRELPLLYSAPMVLACLAGLKTQTRRIPPRNLWGDVAAMLAWGLKRYGEPGDVLYVREAWRVAKVHDRTAPRMLPKHLDQGSVFYEGGPDGLDRELQSILSDDYAWGKLRPGIHMPKWASRIRRTRTEPLRVERVQDISEADALAEGVKPSDAAVVYRGTVRQPDVEMTARGAFLCLWDGINGGRAPVAENPPVIVVSHEAHQAEEARVR
jgi:hypothetical protein